VTREQDRLARAPVLPSGNQAARAHGQRRMVLRRGHDRRVHALRTARDREFEFSAHRDNGQADLGMCAVVLGPRRDSLHAADRQRDFPRRTLRKGQRPPQPLSRYAAGPNGPALLPREHEPVAGEGDDDERVGFAGDADLARGPEGSWRGP
jgi:hypothetical protein